MLYEFSIHFESGQIATHQDGDSIGDSDYFSPKSVNLDIQYSGMIGNNRVDDNGLVDDADYYEVALTESGYLTIDVVESSDDSLDSMFVYIETSNHDTSKLCSSSTIVLGSRESTSICIILSIWLNFRYCILVHGHRLI